MPLMRYSDIVSNALKGAQICFLALWPGVVVFLSISPERIGNRNPIGWWVAGGVTVLNLCFLYWALPRVYQTRSRRR